VRQYGQSRLVNATLKTKKSALVTTMRTVLGRKRTWSRYPTQGSPWSPSFAFVLQTLRISSPQPGMDGDSPCWLSVARPNSPATRSILRRSCHHPKKRSATVSRRIPKRKICVGQMLTPSNHAKGSPEPEIASRHMVRPTTTTHTATADASAATRAAPGRERDSQMPAAVSRIVRDRKNASAIVVANIAARASEAVMLGNGVAPIHSSRAWMFTHFVRFCASHLSADPDERGTARVRPISKSCGALNQGSKAFWGSPALPVSSATRVAR
jgi:hypothetical protein